MKPDAAGAGAVETTFGMPFGSTGLAAVGAGAFAFAELAAAGAGAITVVFVDPTEKRCKNKTNNY